MFWKSENIYIDIAAGKIQFISRLINVYIHYFEKDSLFLRGQL